MGTIAGLADRYADPVMMKKSVFHSRASSRWSSLANLLESRFPDWIGTGTFDYFYPQGFLHRKEDKFGVALWDTLSFGTFDFSREIPRDRYLAEELGCRRSVCLERTGVIAAIWKHAALAADPTDVDFIGYPPKRLTQKNMRAWYAEIGKALGVDTLIHAMEHGVPLEDILDAGEPAALIPDKDWTA